MQEPQDAPKPQPQRLSLQDIKARQNFAIAALAGCGAAAFGALLWAIVTVFSKSEWGLMSIVVGYLVGKSIAHVGGGVDKKFGILGAALAGMGAIAGNFLSTLVLYAQGGGISPTHLLYLMDAHKLSLLLPEFFRPMDFVFYGIAVYEGYRLSFKFRIVKPAATGSATTPKI